MGRVQVDVASSEWKKLLHYIGPGILVSVAYLDPGNLETDLQAGADHKYQLLWIVVTGLLFALIIQSRSANLGVATGKHLAEHCREEYPTPVNYSLWLLAEISVIAADIPEVIGSAFALNILFKIPMWCGVLLAGLNTLLLLGLQRFGIRKLEIVIGTLVMIVGGCFISVMIQSKPDHIEIVKGMFIPKLSSSSATKDAIALLGALIMPHNLFLHSALVISRKIPRSDEGIRTARKFFLLESSLALFVALLINIAVVSVSGSVCSNTNLSTQINQHCKNITLESASFLLREAIGKWSSKLYAISLLASGLSSTVTGTYAGQYIMEGFLDLRMKLWLRNLLTRCVAIVPSLVICIIGGSTGAAKLIIIASMILAFELPFALIPLLKFTSSKAKMGKHKNSISVSLLTWLLGVCSIGINVYFLSTSLLGRTMSKKMANAATILAKMVIFVVIAMYFAMMAYLLFKAEQVVIQSSPASDEMNTAQDNEENDVKNNLIVNESEMDEIITCI